jgi:hypothetical protein
MLGCVHGYVRPDTFAPPVHAIFVRGVIVPDSSNAISVATFIVDPGATGLCRRSSSRADSVAPLRRSTTA